VSNPVQPAYLVDEQQWPLVKVRATPAVHDERAALDETYRLLGHVLEHQQRFVGFLDLRGATSSPTRRRRLLEWCRQHQAAIDQYMVAMAVIVRTSLERGFVTAGLWLSEPPVPTRVFDNPGEAEAWLWVEYSRDEKRESSAGMPPES
jgi:hypothetical protein